MGARSRQRSGRSAAFAAILAFAVALASSAAAQAQTRTATIADPADPGIAFDLRQLGVVLDGDAGTLSLTIGLHGALPAPLPPADRSVTVALGAAAVPTASGSGCTLVPPVSVSDVTLRLAADTSAEALVASVTIAPDPFPRTLPVTLSGDRTELSLLLSDPLLQQAAPRCVTALAHGRAAGDSPQQPGDGSDDDTLSGWFDGYAPGDPGGRDPNDPGDPGTPAPDPPHEGAAPPPAPPVARPPLRPESAAPRSAARACRAIATPGLTWGAFPRELALRSTALVPIEARRDRRVEDVVATIATTRGGVRMGEPTRVELPPRGYALQLRAPERSGRLDVTLTWVERRGPGAGTPCPQRSRGHEIAVVEAQEPRLTLTRDADADRLSLAWGVRGRDCHALERRPLDVRVEGLGYVRSYRVADPCGGWSAPGAALPDIAARRAGNTLQLTPRGEDSGSWSYRLTARSDGRSVLRGLLVVTVAQRDGDTIRTIRFVADRPAR